MMENKTIREEYVNKGFSRAKEIKQLQDSDIELLIRYIVSFI